MIVIGRKGSWIKGLLPCNYSGRTALKSAICPSPPVILSAILMATPRKFDDQRGVMQHIRDDAWNAWTPKLLFDRLRQQSSPWYIVGGWALDLWHRYQTRDHEDLEFCVLSEDVDLYRTVLCELEFFHVLNGATARLAPETTPLPHVSQIWGADLDNRCWRVDMMIEQGTLNDWVYKRDPSFRLPRSAAVQKTPGGIPYLAPTLVLFFKAKHLRDKDMQDFSTALPKLDAQQRSDLESWLRARYPGHQWISSLQ